MFSTCLDHPLQRRDHAVGACHCDGASRPRLLSADAMRRHRDHLVRETIKCPRWESIKWPQHRSLLLDPASEPMSLRKIAQRLNVSVGAMRYHAPLPVAQLAERYKQHQRAARMEKQSAAVDAVLNGIRKWHLDEAAPIANKTLLKRLMKTTGLPKEVLRKAIKDCRR